MALFKKKPKKDATPVAPPTDDEEAGAPFDGDNATDAGAAKTAAPPTPAPVVKPKVEVLPDLYTLLLGLAALFILIGFVLLLLNDFLYQKEGCDASSSVSSYHIVAPTVATEIA